MQDLQGLDPTEFLAAGQQPLIKFEIDVDDAWINICDINEHVIDGGFEQWLSATDLKYWTESIAGGSTINLEDLIVYRGTYSLRFDIDASKSAVRATQSITLIPGSPYLITFWYKGSISPGTLLHFSLTGGDKWLDSSGDWESMDSYDGGFTRSNRTEWTLCSVAFNARDSYSNYSLSIRSCTHSGGVASAQVYIDDLSTVETGLGAGVSGNYLESAGISLGGASMTPDPVEGVWDALLVNQDSIFYPQHPDSALKDYIKTGAKIRISVGATYNNVDYYWQRVTGYMDVPEFSNPDYRVAISGGDYMKHLRDTKLKFPDNYWGDSETYASIPSDGLSTVEMYTNADAMRVTLPACDAIPNWNINNCTFESFDAGGADPDQPSDYVGKVTNQGVRPIGINILDIGVNATEGKMYQVKFKHRIVDGTGIVSFKVRIDQASGRCFVARYFPTDDWQEETFYFTALEDGAIKWICIIMPTEYDLRLDDFSIKEFTPYWMRYYELLGLDPVSKGPYHVTLDGVDVWQGEVDEGWYYAEDELEGEYPHPAEVVFFDPNKIVPIGVDVIVYYYTQQEAQDVVGGLLYRAGLYATAADAITAIETHAEYVDPDVQIDRVWFKVGTTCLEAIKMVCERCDYRFYFDYDGAPVFRPKATEVDPVDFAFTDSKHVASICTYQSRDEIKNRIVIKGWKQAEPVEKEETKPSEFEGEKSDADSIELYGERTLTITNHLFQDQDSILNEAGDAGMCVTLLAEYKDPKWYSDLEIPFNPVPLELGDTISWKERLSPARTITQKGIIRDIKINKFSTTYKCEQV